MSPNGWSCHAAQASLKSAAWSATAQLAPSAPGLFDFKVDGVPVAAGPILAVDLAAADGGTVDAYVRQGDLIASYPQTDQRPFVAQIYWRLVDASLDPRQALVVDLQLSVNTSHWHTCPRLTAGSQLPAAECYWVQFDDAPRAHLFDASQIAGGFELPPRAAGVLFRPRAMSYSYLELVPPEDRVSDRVETSAAACRLTHRLFSPDLEKGVILRSRLRGAWLPRANDLALAEQLYRQFLASPLPLTT